MTKKRKKQLLKLFGVIFGIIMLIVVSISLTGCNYDMIDTQYTYNYAIIQLQNGEVVEGKVQSWKDYEGEQLQVKIGGVIYLTNSYNCTLMYK